MHTFYEQQTTYFITHFLKARKKNLKPKDFSFFGLIFTKLYI